MMNTKIKFEEKPFRKTKLGNLKVGDFFPCSGVLYLKIKSTLHEDNTFELRSQDIFTFPGDLKVNPRDVEILVKKPSDE